MKTKFLILIVLLAGSTMLLAQPLNTTRFEERTFSLGGGGTNLLDTYLSPLNYKGAHAVISSERFKQTKAASGRWFSQSFFALHGDYTKTPSKNGLTIGGMADYSYGCYYSLSPLGDKKQITLYIGPQAQLRIGGIYNLRNSNNPAQLKLGVNVAASAMGKYDFSMRNTPMSLRLQADIPLLGAAFGPDYGQSYYEIFYLGQGKGCVHATSLHNNLSLRSNLCYSIELRPCTLRLTWMEDLYHWSLGGQQYRMFTHTLMIGFVRNLYRVVRDEETRKYMPY